MPAFDPLIGATIAQYEVLAKLGGGGMGVVYKARDTKLGRHVALKFLPSQWSHDDDAKQRFIREAQAASATDHRNICTIHDISATDDGHLFIVMALYDGPTLKQRLSNGPLEIDEALDIATQVAEGLAKAHASGVVHRDIKPGNLIITEDSVKIVDFGLAKFADALQLTTTGSTLGTAAYMSPEQVRGEDAGAQTDVWAVGVILYEMLAGHPPFRGTYAEAIAHAIRSDAPAPLRGIRPEVPEEIEQVVFRALHKDLSVRFASARELARALRQARGQTLPQDLVTQYVTVPASSSFDNERKPTRSLRAFIGVAAAIAIAAALGVAWSLRPVERVPILIAPVINQTGNTELEPYRLALTHSFIQQLRTSQNVRVVPLHTMLQTLRRFIAGGMDVGSREALQALGSAGGARIAVLPTLLYEDRSWRGRVELRDETTATNIASYETAAIVSSLSKDTAQRLVAELAGLVQQHFSNRGLRRVFASTSTAPGLAALDAERDFYEGLNWFEEQEYAAAHRSFLAAADRDARSPLPRAWVSRAALVLRRDDDARDAGDRALGLVTDETPDVDRLFIQSVSAEARGDFTGAEARLRDLIGRHSDDVTWKLELSAFHDRRAASRDAWAVVVNDYHEALRQDPGLIRPHLELCRLYNRLQEPTNAKQQGQEALSMYQAAGWRGGEALARFCLADTLRLGSDTERQQASDHTQLALKGLQEIGFSYNLARAWYYVGSAAYSQGRFSEAAKSFEQAGAIARDSGNIVLQPLLLMNLGATNERLGNITSAADYYRESAAFYDRLGDERRAAQQEANSGALRIVYGLGANEAVRNLRNALAVFQKLGDADFEVFCLQSLGAYHEHAAQYADAERELSRALARARERNLDSKVASVLFAQARVSFDKNDYGEARTRLLEVLKDEGRSRAEAWTLLARVYARLGDFASSQKYVDAAASELQARVDSGIRPQLDLAMGELAYEQGRFSQARMHLQRAASWPNGADEAVVWARAYLGRLDALQGGLGSARGALQMSVAEGRKMERVSLEVVSRVMLAEVSMLGKQPAEARRAFEGLPGSAEQGLGMELRAMVHYWRGRALAGVGDPAGNSEIDAARKLLEQVLQALPVPYRQQYVARPDIRRMLE